MAGADSDRQRVDAGVRHEPNRLFGRGQQLVVAQRALGAMPVFLLALSGFQRAQAAQFAFDGDAAGVRQSHHLGSHLHVVGVVPRRLAVFLQRAVHHDGGEAVVDRTHARLDAVAVILVHHDRDCRIQLGSRQHQVLQVRVLRVRAGAAGRLDDHRGIRLLGRLHDGLDLLHVIDVQCGDAIVVLGRVIQERPQGNQRHVTYSSAKVFLGMTLAGRSQATAPRGKLGKVPKGPWGGDRQRRAVRLTYRKLWRLRRDRGERLQGAEQIVELRLG